MLVLVVVVVKLVLVKLVFPARHLTMRLLPAVTVNVAVIVTVVVVRLLPAWQMAAMLP